jgi:mannose/fructose/N-acetylgalactosamine-specific phosphotransferase system component IIB
VEYSFRLFNFSRTVIPASLENNELIIVAAAVLELLFRQFCVTVTVPSGIKYRFTSIPHISEVIHQNIRFNPT